MKSASISVFGGPEVVTLHYPGMGKPGAEEVLVRVEAASVNPLDLKIIAGYMQPVFPIELPYVPGTDFSGIVSSIGEQVTQRGLRPWWNSTLNPAKAMPGKPCSLPAPRPISRKPCSTSVQGSCRL